ncbi:YDG domain-containing protein, partial [Janthinobacterium agaricidamnosum]
HGGFIDTSARQVRIDEGIRVTSAAAKGLAGTWLIDPADFNIAASGGDISGALLSRTLMNGNVNILSTMGASGTQGNINVNDTVAWSAHKLTLNAQNNININRAMLGSGSASLALEYGQGSALGAGSAYHVAAPVNLPAGNNFSTKQGSGGALVAYTVLNSLGAAGSVSQTDLQGVNGGLAGNYVLGSDIDASSTAGWNGGAGFTPLGAAPGAPFTGRFDGLGHVINGLTMNRVELDTGLFGTIGAAGVVRNLGLTGGSIELTGELSGIYPYPFSVAPLAAVNHGLIDNSHASVPVTSSNYAQTAGLVGLNAGTISNSSASGNVTDSNYAGAGGLVSLNSATGIIQNSFASGNVSVVNSAAGGLVMRNEGSIGNSYANGNISGTSGAGAGGLVGQNVGGSISNSYATGDVAGDNTLGGLVGSNDNLSSISNSYATGSVVGSGSTIGGLAGANQGTASNVYATGAVTGFGNVGGLVGGNSGALANGYASGKVTASNAGGGVIGLHSGGAVANLYFNSSINNLLSGKGNQTGGSGSASGLSTSQMTTASNYAGLNFSSTPGAPGNAWVLVNASGGGINNAGGGGGTYPMLASEYSTTIGNAHQLQLMAMDLGPSAVYTLGRNIDAGKTVGTGDVWFGSFIPLGASLGINYLGSLDGQGHVISGLNVNLPGNTQVGLFGVIGGSGKVVNLGLDGGSVRGQFEVGAIAGRNQGAISNSFSTAAVQGDTTVGGLVGFNSLGSVSNAYASGPVAAVNGETGGLVGKSQAGAISNSFANGAVSSTSGTTGGLLASSSGDTISGSFWDINGTGRATSAIGPGQYSPSGGLFTAVTRTLAIYAGAGWDLTGSWVVYDGVSAPLLRSFMTQYTVLANSDSKTYDGLAYSGNSGFVVSGVADGRISGSVTVAGSAQGAVNAGDYALRPGGLVSSGGQLGGYSINYIDGALTVNRALLSVSGASADNKIYDGLLGAQISNAVFSGLVAGDAGLVNLTSSFASKNAGNGIAVTVGLDGASAGNYTLAPVTGLSANITPKALSISGLAAGNKVYDGSGTTSLSGGTLNGLVAGETLAFSASGAFADPNAGIAKTVTVSGATLADGSGLASNYTVGNPTGLTADITPKGLTISGMSAAAKVYDGLLHASLSGGTLVGLVNGETLSFSNQSGVFSDQNAGMAKAVTVSGTTLADGSGLASNYTVSDPTGLSADITPKALTVSGLGAASKVYDGLLNASLSGGTLLGLVNGETLSITKQSGAFSDQNAGIGKAVTVSGTTLADGTGLASNYTVSDPTGLTADIIPKALTIVGVTAGNKIYDGNMSASLSGGTLSGFVGSETVGLSGLSGAFSDKHAGAGKAVTVTGAMLTDGTGLASNYTVGNPAGLTADIGKATITGVSGISAGNKVYDGTAAASLETAGALFAGLVGGDDVLVAHASGVFSDQNAGAGKTVAISGLALGGADAGNYSLASGTASATADITPRALTLTGITAGNKVYDGNTKASLSGGTLNGLVGSETLGVTGLSAAFADKNAAHGIAVTVSGATLADGSGLASNYSIGNPAGLTADITPKALTLAGVQAADKVYDGTTAASLSGGSLIGLVGGETLGIAGQAGTFSDKQAGSGKTVLVSGTTLLDGTGLASNYTVSDPLGLTASIGRATISSVSGITAGDKVYDSTTLAALNTAGASFNGMLAGDQLSVAGAGGLFSDKNVGSGKTVAISGIALGGADAGNYLLASDTASSSATIAAATLTASASGIDKVYDGGTKASVTLGDNRLAGDVLTVSNSGAQFSDKNVASGKAVTVSGISLSGADAGNYIVNDTAGTSASITPATLTVSASGIDKVYDAGTAASVTLRDNRIGNDVLSISSGSVNFSDKNAGVGKTVTVNGISISGADAGNYTVNTTASTSASITPALLTVKVNNAEKDQGGINPAFSVSYNGLLGADTVASEVSGDLRFNTPAGAGSVIGNYLVSAAGHASNNYALNYVDGVLTVNPTVALQSAVANVIGVTAVVPAQGNMVASDVAVGLDASDNKGEARTVKPLIQASGALASYAVPGLNLTVIDRGMNVPAEARAASAADD